MIRRLIRFWKQRQRDLDVVLLWPSCKREAGNRADAEMVFRVHMEMDPAYNDLTAAEKDALLRELP